MLKAERFFHHFLCVLHFDPIEQVVKWPNLVADQWLGQVVKVPRGCNIAAQKLLCAPGKSRHNWREPDHQNPEQIQSLSADSLELVILAGFAGDDPGLAVVDVLVGPISEGHDFTHRAAEFATFVGLGDRSIGVNKVLEQRRIG